MIEYDELNTAINSLSESISNFPIGAISLEDFKPITEKVIEARRSLKPLRARILMLKAQRALQSVDEDPEEDVADTLGNLREATAKSLINYRGIRLCHSSYTIQEILEGNEGDSNLQEKVYEYIRKLFILNDNALTLEKDIDEARQKQLELKIQCQNAIFDYKNFLKEQEEIRKKELEKTNPQIAKIIHKTHKVIRDINIKKKLIVSLISASHHMLHKNEILLKMLVNHREPITTEKILKMVQEKVTYDSDCSEESTENEAE